VVLFAARVGFIVRALPDALHAGRAEAGPVPIFRVTRFFFGFGAPGGSNGAQGPFSETSRLFSDKEADSETSVHASNARPLFQPVFREPRRRAGVDFSRQSGMPGKAVYGNGQMNVGSTEHL
jgi:hypothetical protein